MKVREKLICVNGCAPKDPFFKGKQTVSLSQSVSQSVSQLDG